MKHNLIFLLSAISVFISCNDGKSNDEADVKENTTLKKPSSNYQDTLVIDFTAAVFYHPDSLQLLKIQQVVDSAVYEATMHEYFYQMRNARIVLNKDWPNIRIIEANKVRYLLFKKGNNQIKIVDLDSKGEPHGLYLFDHEHDPEPADMMNIDTELPRYFAKRSLK